jgi:hypothetical protein
MLPASDIAQSSCGGRNGHHILTGDVSSKMLSGDGELTQGLAFACVDGPQFPQRSYPNDNHELPLRSPGSRFTRRKENISQSLNLECPKYQHASADITAKRLAPVFVTAHWPNLPRNGSAHRNRQVFPVPPSGSTMHCSKAI